MVHPDAASQGLSPVEAADGYIGIEPASTLTPIDVTMTVVTSPQELAQRVSEVPANGQVHLIPIQFPGNLATTGTQAGNLPVIDTITIAGNRHIVLDSNNAINQVWNRNQIGGAEPRHLIVSNGATLELRNVSISRDTAWVAANNTVNSGGIAVLRSGSDVGAILGNLILQPGSVISNNRSASNGGGITSQASFPNTGTFTMYGGAVRNNVSGVQGGGIGWYGNRFYMHGGEFSGNMALLNDGGGVSIGVTTTLATMTGGSIRNNENISQWGGGLSLFNSAPAGHPERGDHWKEFIFSGGEIRDNTAFALGAGGVLMNGFTTSPAGEGGSIFTIAGADPKYITGNTATAGLAGGVAIAGNTFLNVEPGAENIFITNNHAATDGGGIHTWTSQYQNPLDLTVGPLPYSNITLNENVVFSGNTAGAGAHTPPSNAFALASLTNFASTSIYNHPLNNYDINYRFAVLLVDDVEPSGFEVAITEDTLTITFDREVDISAGTREVTIARHGQPPITIPVPNNLALWAESPSSAPSTVLTLPMPTSLLPLQYATRYDVTIQGFQTPGILASPGMTFVGTMPAPHNHTFITESEGIDTLITKELLMPYPTTTPNASFSFNIVPYSLNNDTSNVATSTMPALSIPDITFSPSDTGTDISVTTGSRTETITVVTGHSNYILGNINITDIFTHAGIFTYRITEIPNTNSATLNPDTETMAYDQREWQLTFLVHNLPSPAQGLYVAAIYMQRVNSDGTLTSDKAGPITFENRFVRNHDEDPYNPVSGFVISKQIVGDFADRTRNFEFAITLHTPSLVTTLPAITTTPVTYRAYVIETSATGIRSNVTSASHIVSGVTLGGTTPNQYLVFTSGTTGYINLRHNQELVFVNTHVGTTYTAIELAAPNYIPTVSIVTGSQVTTLAATPPNTDNVELSTQTRTLGESANRADFTNTHLFTPPTGLEVGSFSLLLIVVGIASLVLLLESLRRARKSVVLETLS